MLVSIAQWINLFATPLYWVCLVSFAYVFFSDQATKEKLSRLLFLVFLNMPINAAFKCFFKFPLATHLGTNWYAFPSGHMQFATIFVVWLALEYRKKWLYYATPIILAIRGWALIAGSFHSLLDITAAIIAGLFVIMFYKLIYKIAQQKLAAQIGFLTTFICLLLMTLIPYGLDFHWASVGGSLGLALGLFLLHKFPHYKTSKLQAFLKTFLAVAGTGIILLTINTLHMRLFWISFSCAGMLWITIGIEILFKSMHKFFGLKNKILKKR